MAFLGDAIGGSPAHLVRRVPRRSIGREEARPRSHRIRTHVLASVLSTAILLHLDLPHKPHPLLPACGAPQSDLLTGLLDPTPAFDPAEPDPVPDFQLDQSWPDDLDP
jgi:hypothetical protein